MRYSVNEAILFLKKFFLDPFYRLKLLGIERTRFSEDRSWPKYAFSSLLFAQDMMAAF